MQITTPTKQPLPISSSSSDPGVGKHLLMHTHIPPTFNDANPGLGVKQSAFEIITALDHEHHRAAWKNIDYPSWMLRATRWQVLTPIDGRTRYETREVFAGLLAYVVYWFFGG